MVRSQLQARNFHSPDVLRAISAVPRHEFVPFDQRAHSYDDYPLPLGPEQTISQPYIVALMTQECGARQGSRVLEIGTGSGYQAAVLAELGARVYTLEIDPGLAARAGVPVLAGPVEATALGNGLVQGIALGLYPDLAAARRVLSRSVLDGPEPSEPSTAERSHHTQETR